MENKESINYVGKSVSYTVSELAFSGVILEDNGDTFKIFLTDMLEYTPQLAKDESLNNIVPKSIMQALTITGTKF